MTSPDDAQALAFATMLHAGLTAADALVYFLSGNEDPEEVATMLRVWSRSRRVRIAMLKLMGKPFHEMDAEEQISAALRLHYAQLAAFLFTHHYAELTPAEKAKADTARTSLEAKQAGTAGKADPLTRFFDDLNSGRLKLGGKIPTPMGAH